MAYPNRDNRSGGRSNFKGGGRDGGGRGFGGGGRSFGGGGGSGFGGRPTMHKATCDECGNRCEVPFKPTGDRPVLCSECFEVSKGGSGNRNFEKRGGGKSDGYGFDDRRRTHRAICDDCGNECELPFKPAGDKPVYCSNCFGSSGNSKTSFEPKGKGVTPEQWQELSNKVDKILHILAPVVSSKAPSSKAPEEKKATKEVAPKETVEKPKEKVKPKAKEKEAPKKPAPKAKKEVKKAKR